MNSWKIPFFPPGTGVCAPFFRGNRREDAWNVSRPPIVRQLTTRNWGIRGKLRELSGENSAIFSGWPPGEENRTPGKTFACAGGVSAGFRQISHHRHSPPRYPCRAPFSTAGKTAPWKIFRPLPFLFPKKREPKETLSVCHLSACTAPSEVISARSRSTPAGGANLHTPVSCSIRAFLLLTICKAFPAGYSGSKLHLHTVTLGFFFCLQFVKLFQ